MANGVARNVSGRAGGDDFEALFESAPCGFLCVSTDWRILRANATFAEWIGHDASALVGRAFIDLLDIAGKIYVNTHFAPLLRLQGKFDEVALNVVRADGSKLSVLVNASERRDADGALRMVLVSIFNATDRRRYEGELLDARNQLREANETLERRVEEAVAERLRAEEALAHAQRMEAIGNLSAGIAHDFNNLLQIIGGNLQLLRKHVASEAGRTRIENAVGGVERGARLASQLLAFGRRQGMDVRVHDLGAAVTTLADSLVSTLGGEVGLRVEADQERAGQLNARVDLVLLENAVINLAVNARDAMRGADGIAAGTITLTVAAKTVASETRGTAVGSVQAGDYVTITVEDTGSGMPPEVAHKVFDPFFTTKGPGEGTGLGLPMVYGFATQSDGHVTIDSAPGEGTRVRLWLPRTADPVGADLSAHASTPQRGHETILVVEDDEAVLAITRELLSDLGYEVLTAADGIRALAVLEANKPIDLVLTDIVMPGSVRGTALATLVRKNHPGTALLFTTGYTDAAARLDMGVDAPKILRKPFTPEALAAMVRKALGRDDGAPGARSATHDATSATSPGNGSPDEPAMPARGTSGQSDKEAPYDVEPPRRGDKAAAEPHVLLVEDEMFIRMDAAELLTDLGCDVTDVGTIAEALKLLADRPFDVVVTDVELEDGSGIGLAREIRERYPDMRIVFATGHGAVEGADALSAAVLLKPYDEQTLRKALGLKPV